LRYLGRKFCDSMAMEHAVGACDHPRFCQQGPMASVAQSKCIRAVVG
jgi:hypothetical protein